MPILGPIVSNDLGVANRRMPTAEFLASEGLAAHPADWRYEPIVIDSAHWPCGATDLPISASANR